MESRVSSWVLSRGQVASLTEALLVRVDAVCDSFNIERQPGTAAWVKRDPNFQEVLVLEIPFRRKVS